MTKPKRPNLMFQLVVANAEAAIRFYREAFDASETTRFEVDGVIMHAELAIRGSLFALSEVGHDRGPLDLGGSPVILTLEVGDVDAVAARAASCGATLLIPVADQFYGYRQGRIRDPFGHVWILSTKQRDMTVAEMHEALAKS